MDQSTFNDIPEELLLKIFYLQPMNSLLLLRNVCKLWDQIISSEYFNEFHLARERTSSNASKYLLLEGASKSISLVDSENYMYHDIPMKNFECYGICHGLLCLASSKGGSKEHSSIILWNPIFRKIVPPLKLKYSELTYMCFGHHDNDYKVIRVVVFFRVYYVCIYSLSMDSWKILKFDGTITRTFNYSYMLSAWSLHYSKGRVLNDAAYFVNFYGKNDRAIIYFDLSHEVFREFPMPCWIGSNFIMEEYKESLALIGYRYSFCDCGCGREMDVAVLMWVLSKSDNSFSWDEILLVYREINNVHVQLKPIGFKNKDELVIRLTCPNATHNVSFFLCDLDNECYCQFTAPATGLPMVDSYYNVKSFISFGVNARKSGFDESRKYIKPISSPTPRPSPCRQPMVKKVASTSNSYAALADSGVDLLDKEDV